MWIFKARCDLIELNWTRFQTNASPLCSMCNMYEIENLHHFLGRCVALKQFRQTIFKKSMLTYEETINILNGYVVNWKDLQPVHRTFFWVIRTPNGKRFLLLVSVHFFLSANKKSFFFTEKFGSTNSNTSKTSCQIRRSNNSNRRVAIIIKNGWKWISLPKNCKYLQFIAL